MGKTLPFGVIMQLQVCLPSLTGFFVALQLLQKIGTIETGRTKLRLLCKRAFDIGQSKFGRTCGKHDSEIIERFGIIRIVRE